MNLRTTTLILALLAFGGVLNACAPATLTPDPTLQSVTQTPNNGSTPLPVRTPHPPGLVVTYNAQSGDMLQALAAHFNTTVEEIKAENPDLPPNITTLPPGYPLQIPAYYVPLTGSPFHIVPDNEVVYGPSAADFDIEAEIRQRDGYLRDLSDFAYQRQREAWQVVQVIAQNYSINPRLLLALLEFQTQALSKSIPEGNESEYPMGVEQPRYRRLVWQLIWTAERLNDGYYGWRNGTLSEFELADGMLIHPDPWLNAGTVAVQLVFAGIYGKSEFDQAVSPTGFYRTYQELWGDPFELVVPIIPGSLQQPELSLPFVPNRIWDFTAGPHFSWGTSLPLGALDFGPPAVESGCTPSAEWITAPADGVIARSGEAVVVLDLDGDGFEGTGWVLFFFHVESEDRISEGVQVRQGDFLGHPSCEGGRATGTHFHLARRYNGEWIPAGGPLAFELGGWVCDYGDQPYLGRLTRGSKTVTASEISSRENRILYELP